MNFSPPSSTVWLGTSGGSRPSGVTALELVSDWLADFDMKLVLPPTKEMLFNVSASLDFVVSLALVGTSMTSGLEGGGITLGAWKATVQGESAGRSARLMLP